MMVGSMRNYLFLGLFLFLLSLLDLVEVISKDILGIIQSFLLNFIILINLLHHFLLIYNFLIPIIGLCK